MAKKSQVLRDQGRAKLIKKFAEKRAVLRKQLQDPKLSMEEKFEVQEAFAKLPRNSCPTRVTRRCRITGRSHAVYRKFGVSRIMLRELTLKGELPRDAQVELVAMKEGIHPDYHTVLFVDNATGKEWLGRSTLKSDKTKKIDGEDVPIVHLEISAESHPFWTGQQRELDAEGRVDRFRKRYQRKK